MKYLLRFIFRLITLPLLLIFTFTNIKDEKELRNCSIFDLTIGEIILLIDDAYECSLIVCWLVVSLITLNVFKINIEKFINYLK